MLGKLVSSSSMISIVLVAILLQATSPASIGPLGIFVFFILVYISVLGVLTYLLFWASQLLVKVPLLVTATKRVATSFSLRRAYYFSSVLALAPVMIIGMQSVDEVGIYETLLVVFFTIIACVYISKRTS
jgi:hypothetical protein